MVLRLWVKTLGTFLVMITLQKSSILKLGFWDVHRATGVLTHCHVVTIIKRLPFAFDPHLSERDLADNKLLGRSGWFCRVVLEGQTPWTPTKRHLRRTEEKHQSQKKQLIATKNNNSPPSYPPNEKKTNQKKNKKKKRKAGKNWGLLVLGL